MTARAKAALTIRLTNAPSLDGLTVGALTRAHRLPPAEIARMLTAERARRAAR